MIQPIWDAIRVRLPWVVSGFAAGMLVTTLLYAHRPETAPIREEPAARATRAEPAAPPVLQQAPVLHGSALEDLRSKHLGLPVQGLTRDRLQPSFNDRRSLTRVHEAIDIQAPRNTPVLAVEDGVVAKLFLSKAGGITIYQFDPTTTYVYYYAHLERYASGLIEGAHVRRGDVVGYVGTSGNAPKDTPHLHFAIFLLTERRRWWEGDPIDPYLVLK